MGLPSRAMELQSLPMVEAVVEAEEVEVVAVVEKRNAQQCLSLSPVSWRRLDLRLNVPLFLTGCWHGFLNLLVVKTQHWRQCKTEFQTAYANQLETQCSPGYATKCKPQYKTAYRCVSISWKVLDRVPSDLKAAHCDLINCVNKEILHYGHWHWMSSNSEGHLKKIVLIPPWFIATTNYLPQSVSKTVYEQECKSKKYL